MSIYGILRLVVYMCVLLSMILFSVFLVFREFSVLGVSFVTCVSIVFCMFGE